MSPSRMSPSRISPSHSICVEHSVDPVERAMGRVKLPEPDLKNITALTENLPNVPILPWNHYDNPQAETEAAIES